MKGHWPCRNVARCFRYWWGGGAHGGPRRMGPGAQATERSLLCGCDTGTGEAAEAWRSCVCVSVCVCTYLSCVGGGARALWGEALPPSLPSPCPIQPEHPQMHTLTGSRALKTQFHFPIHKYLCKSGHSKPNHLPMSHTKCEDT